MTSAELQVILKALNCPQDLNSKERSELRSILEGMEQAHHHELTPEEWGRLLLVDDHDEYADPPSPSPLSPCEENALTPKARIAIYRKRVRRKQSLYRSDDIWRRTSALKVGVEVERLRNGSDSVRGIA